MVEIKIKKILIDYYAAEIIYQNLHGKTYSITIYT